MAKTKTGLRNLNLFEKRKKPAFLNWLATTELPVENVVFIVGSVQYACLERKCVNEDRCHLWMHLAVRLMLLLLLN